jgi:hypothetical protein
MTAWLRAGFGSLLCLVAGCSSAAEEAAAVAKAVSVSPANVVAKLRFRDVDLVITRAEASPRFTVVDRSGMSLATGLEEADLRKHHPDLYSAYRFGHARGPFLDARLDLPRENRRSPDGL